MNWLRLLRIAILAGSAVGFWVSWKSGNRVGQILASLSAFCAIMIPDKKRREFRRFPRRFRG
jgi:hypothetical protein